MKPELNYKPYKLSDDIWGWAITIVAGMIIAANIGGCARQYNLLDPRKCVNWTAVQKEMDDTQMQCLKENKDGIICQRDKMHVFWAGEENQWHHSHDLEQKECVSWK